MKLRTDRRRKRIAQWRGMSSYRIPMQIWLYMQHWQRDAYPICPRCDQSLERSYLSYCYHCGQKLGWDQLSEAFFIKAGDKERKIYGKRRVRLTVTIDEGTGMRYVAAPRTKGRHQ